MSKNDLHKALGPLAPLFENPETSELMVDGPGRVTIEKFRSPIENTDVRFKSNDELKDVIRAILEAVGVELEDGRNIYDVRLTDNSRMMAVLSPVAINGHSIIFRKWVAHPITWEKMLEYNSVSPEMRDLIQSAVDAHISMLIAGGTSSGKTTFANRVVELIPPGERIIAVEQVREFRFTHPRAVFLEADDSANVKMNELMVAGSKMRPDWLVIGELHGAETMQALQIFANGHNGIATMHADNTENALTRLEAMCLMANLGLGLEDIRRTIASAIRLVLYTECLEPNRNRKVTQITELRGLENGRYILQPLMRYNPEMGLFEMTGAKPGWKKQSL